ncbi:hypothetical protein [Bacillus thuringiensis]|uniref:hypothetical protein n=1 Tax=Bacillus thuringiensis TaxID=1428 RepID=UPI000BFDB00C|nr:hypothetical protein [Bacillus thuringiensis]PGT90051.1 hypothetical protein COD17_09890 [Bacillus thuringiensis]
MATVWNVGKIVGILEKLKEKGRTGIPNLMTYLLVPYTESAGHNPYDFDSAEILLDEGKVIVKIADDLSLVISLTMDFPYEPTQRMLLYVDEADRTMTLYFKVLDGWEKVTELDMTSGNAQQMYSQISKYVVKERLLSEYNQKGSRMLTENVVDRQLEEGNLENDFLRNVLIMELQNPSDELIMALVNRLSSEYTTKDKPWLTERLSGLKSAGLENMVTAIVGDGLLETGNKYSYVPTPAPKDEPTPKKEEEKPAPKQEEKPAPTPKKEEKPEPVLVPAGGDTEAPKQEEKPYYNNANKSAPTGGGNTVDLSQQFDFMDKD